MRHSAPRCPASLHLAACCLATLLHLAPAAAAPISFSAQVSGVSDITGVLDPAGPVVQIQTTASGPGSLGVLRYVSADVVNLATGQGTGQNRFVADDGAELYGRFTVQLLPTADPLVLDLLGMVDFTGGSLRFAGADGWASFTGQGRFTSAASAVSSFRFDGSLLLVPEPPAVVLLLTGLAAALAGQRWQRGRGLR